MSIRIWGDPFAAGARARRLRAVLHAAEQRGVRAAICLTGARGDPEGVQAVPLSDGARGRALRTDIDGAELELVVRAARRAVAATAPLVVFGSADDVLLAALEYPAACLVLDAGDAGAETLIERAVGAATRCPADECAVELAPFLAIPAPTGRERTILHCEAGPRSGLELVERALEELGLAPRLRVHRAGEPLCPVLFADAAAIVQPCSVPPPRALLARLLAAGRPLVASRFARTAAVLGRVGTFFPVGGRIATDGFRPSLASLVHALRRAIATEAAAPAARGRRHAVERFAAPRPMAPPAERPSGDRPLVVLEAPVFETSSSAELTIETARALVRRGRVEVLLRPSLPFASDLGAFAARAPELVARLCRRPPHADLWLSSGWPPRADRPAAERFGLRVDWEYGALPTELTPAVSDEADVVVVHSEAVRRVVAAAGTSSSRIAVIPHGVDGDVFHERAAPCPAVVEFAHGRRAVLFAGGPIWRKGFDVVVRTMLERFSRADPVCLVVKSVGAASSYHGYELSALLERMRAFDRAVEVLVLDSVMSPCELAGVYRACDVLFHPYRGEGFGMPVLEARACGLPVVVTAGGSTDDFCDEADGVLCIPSTPREIELDAPHEGRPFVLEPDGVLAADRLVQAFEPSVRSAAHAAAQRVRARYSWARAAASIEALAFASCRRTSVLKEVIPTGRWRSRPSAYAGEGDRSRCWKWT